MSWLSGIKKVVQKLDPVGMAITKKTKGKLDPIGLYKTEKQSKQEAEAKAKATVAAVAQNQPVQAMITGNSGGYAVAPSSAGSSGLSPLAIGGIVVGGVVVLGLIYLAVKK